MQKTTSAVDSGKSMSTKSTGVCIWERDTMSVAHTTSESTYRRRPTQESFPRLQQLLLGEGVCKCCTCRGSRQRQDCRVGAGSTKAG